MPACRACAARPDTEEVVETIVAEAVELEGYVRAKETGEDRPVYDCGECGRAAYIDSGA